MSETTYISPRMLVRDLLRRQPRADSVLRRLGVDVTFLVSGTVIACLIVKARAALDGGL